MPFTRHSDNRQVLDDAQDLQRRSKESVRRTQEQISQTHELGATTLEELQAQRRQLERVEDSTDQVDAQLDKTGRLLNRFDRWAGNWRGNNKREARKEAKSEVAKLEPRDKTQNETMESIDIRARNSTVKSARSSRSTKPAVQVEKGGKAEKLDRDSQTQLDEIQRDDQDLDGMLDDLGGALDQLTQLSTDMRQETLQSSKAMDRTTDKIAQTQRKQATVMGRLRRNIR